MARAREFKDMRILELLGLWSWHLKAMYKKNEKSELVETDNAKEHRKAINEIDIELGKKLIKRFDLPGKSYESSYKHTEGFHRSMILGFHLEREKDAVETQR
jgi:hypothetical protein